MQFGEALRRFDAHMQVIGRSPKTRHSYRRELTNFWCDFLLFRGIDVDEATEDDLVAYVASLPANGSKRGDALRALRALYGWSEGRIRLNNPAQALKIPPRRLSPAPNISDADLRKLLRALFRREPRRGWAAMLCFATGARVGSLVALEARDVDFDLGRITFRVTKGDRPYALPLTRMSGIAAKHLMEARASCHGQLDAHAPPKGPSRGGMVSITNPTLVGVGAERFRQWLHQAEADAGLTRVWPHLLRHGFSNRVGKDDPDAWRRAMNHVDLSQWGRYHAADDERLREAVAGARLTR